MLVISLGGVLIYTVRTSSERTIFVYSKVSGKHELYGYFEVCHEVNNVNVGNSVNGAGYQYFLQ